MTPKEKEEDLMTLFNNKVHDVLATEVIISDYYSYRVKGWLSLKAAKDLAKYWEEVKKELEKKYFKVIERKNGRLSYCIVNTRKDRQTKDITNATSNNKEFD